MRQPDTYQASVASVHWGEAGSPLTAAPHTTDAITIDPRISAIAAGIAAAIPEAQVRLF